MIRVVHYLNQFFAGVGAEQKADTPLGFMKGPIGPGLALEKELKREAEIVATIYAGDNYANEHSEEFVEAALEKLREIRPDVIVAGPAFNAGRYGLACGLLLQHALEKLGIPGVTGLNPDNPAVEMYRSSTYIVPTARSATGMPKALPVMARLAYRLGDHSELGPAKEEGYLPRGIRRNLFTGENAALRAADMAIARARGLPFQSELEAIPFDSVVPPPPIKDLSRARIALVTEGGIVPAGNPDRLETRSASKWFHYSLAGRDLKKGDFEAWHGGYITDWANDDPNRNIPLDAMRFLETSGTIGKLDDEYCVTTGNAGAISNMRRIGQEIAVYLKEKRVDGVVLTGT
jgi:betaine reductase